MLEHALNFPASYGAAWSIIDSAIFDWRSKKKIGIFSSKSIEIAKKMTLSIVKLKKKTEIVIFWSISKFTILNADWQQFIAKKLWAWEQMNIQWAKHFTGDVLVVYYDDLVDNTDVVLRSILDFINFPINQVIRFSIIKVSAWSAL